MAQRSGAGFKSNIDAQFTTNGAGLVTAATVRTHLGQDIPDSFLNKTDGGTVTGSLGIGVTPTHKVDVTQTATTNGYAAVNALNSGVNVGTAYGVIGQATGASVTNVGAYFAATGATNNYGLIVADGRTGLGTSSPTAVLHLKAGTATANTAPLKLTTGTALTTPEDGALEYHSSHLYFTIGSTRYQLDQQVTSTLASGTFTPTLTANTNLDSAPTATALTAKYTRVGDIVTVTMYVNVDPTASGAYSFYATIPVASNFAATTDLIGLGSSGGADGHRCEVVADITNDRAQISGTSSGTAAATLYLMYSYKVI